LNAKEYPCFVQVITFIPGTICTGKLEHSYGQSGCLLTGWDAATPDHYITESVLSSCSDGSGGFDNGDDGPYDPTETTGGGGTHTTVTTPTFEPCETCVELGEDNNCNELKKIKSRSNIQSNIYDLVDELGNSPLGNLSSEASFMVDIAPNDSITTRINYGSPGIVSVTVRQKSFGAMHVHNVGIDPMFDPGDLLVICKMANTFTSAPPSNTNNYYNPSAFFNIMVTTNYAYAVLPNDVEAFKTKCDYLNNNWKILNEGIKDIFKELKKNNQNNQLDYAKAFLDYINNSSNPNLNFDVSLYRISTNRINKNDWTKLTLDNTKPHGISEDSCD
jgi:hypothetical protein